MRRKTSLIHSRLWFATIMLAISCIFSSAIPANKASKVQIHARLEEELPPYYGDPYSNNTDYWQPVTLNVRFYADAACTTPIALSTNVTYDISVTGYELLDGDYQILSGVYGRGRAYKGETATYYDGDVPTWEALQVYNGVVMGKTKRDYELTSIDGGVIIEPAVTASHLPGF